MIVGYNAGR